MSLKLNNCLVIYHLVASINSSQYPIFIFLYINKTNIESSSTVTFRYKIFIFTKKINKKLSNNKAQVDEQVKKCRSYKAIKFEFFFYLHSFWNLFKLRQQTASSSVSSSNYDYFRIVRVFNFIVFYLTVFFLIKKKRFSVGYIFIT